MSKLKTGFRLGAFYDAVNWPVFKNALDENGYDAIEEILDYCEGWQPAEVASALVLAYQSTGGKMRDAIIRRIRYREPVASERVFRLAHERGAEMAVIIQDALLNADWT